MLEINSKNQASCQSGMFNVVYLSVYQIDNIESRVVNPAGKMPALQVHAGKMPALQVYAGKMPALQVYAGKMPALQVYASKMPALQVYAGKMPALQVYAGKMPALQSRGLHFDMGFGFANGDKAQSPI